MERIKGRTDLKGSPPQGWSSDLFAESVASLSDSRDVCWFVWAGAGLQLPSKQEAALWRTRRAQGTRNWWHGCAERAMAQRKPHTEGVGYPEGAGLHIR